MSQRRIDIRLLAGDGLQQILRALERQLGVAVLRLELRDIGLIEVDLRLKRRLLELVEEIVLLDLGALDKQPLFEKGGDPRNQRHPADGLDAPDELVGLRDLLPLGAHHPDRRRPPWCGLGVRFAREQGQCEDQVETPHRRTLVHADPQQPFRVLRITRRGPVLHRCCGRTLGEPVPSVHTQCK